MTGAFDLITLPVKRVANLRNWSRLRRGAMLGLSLSFLTACSGLLPQERTVVSSPFDTYGDAQRAFNTVIPHETSLEQLFNSGYNISTFPNVETLTYLDLIERFMPRDSIRFEHLDGGLRKCLESRLNCRGYVIMPEKIKVERVGNFILDMLEFRRTEVTTGWQSEALFVLQDDVVVYKLWSGTQQISKTKQTINPLGPLNDLVFTVKASYKKDIDP